jgi:hypothetical protein
LTRSPIQEQKKVGKRYEALSLQFNFNIPVVGIPAHAGLMNVYLVGEFVVQI